MSILSEAEVKVIRDRYSKVTTSRPRKKKASKPPKESPKVSKPAKSRKGRKKSVKLGDLANRTRQFYKMCALSPGLRNLETKVKALAGLGQDVGVHVWLGYKTSWRARTPVWEIFSPRHELSDHVGFYCEVPELQNSDAYDVAYHHLYDLICFGKRLKKNNDDRLVYRKFGDRCWANLDSFDFNFIPEVATCYVVITRPEDEREKGKILYIGSTFNLRNRMEDWGWINDLGELEAFGEPVVIKFKCGLRYGEWKMIEDRLIAKLNPPYNKRDNNLLDFNPASLEDVRCKFDFDGVPVYASRIKDSDVFKHVRHLDRPWKDDPNFDPETYWGDHPNEDI